MKSRTRMAVLDVDAWATAKLELAAGQPPLLLMLLLLLLPVDKLQACWTLGAGSWLQIWPAGK